MNLLALEIVLLIIQLGLLVGTIVFCYRVLVFAISGHMEVPFVPTPRRFAPTVLMALEVDPDDVIYELGSGDGKFMLECARLAPLAKFVGVERNPILHLAALMRKRLAGDPPNAEFRRGNFFEIDYSPANKMYLYLLDPVMRELQPKFEKEFKGRIASRAFPFSRKKLANVIELTETVGAHGQHLLFIYDF